MRPQLQCLLVRTPRVPKNLTLAYVGATFCPKSASRNSPVNVFQKCLTCSFMPFAKSRSGSSGGDFFAPLKTASFKMCSWRAFKAHFSSCRHVIHFNFLLIPPSRCKKCVWLRSGAWFAPPRLRLLALLALMLRQDLRSGDEVPLWPQGHHRLLRQHHF